MPELMGDGMDLVAMEPTLEEVLDEGVRRLKDKGTWKLWSWMPEGEEFFDAEAFRTFITVRGDRLRPPPIGMCTSSSSLCCHSSLACCGIDVPDMHACA